MKLLALEFSSAQRSVALLDSDSANLILSYQFVTSRAVTGMMLIDRALHQARVTPAEITVVALGLGPGSYTGIRSAIATAQGWQLAHDIQVIGISSVEVLARDAQKKKNSNHVIVVIDAQRNELYTATYDLTRTPPLATVPLQITSRSNVPAAHPIVGPEASKFFPRATDLFPRADTLAELARVAGTHSPAELLEPIYLRETAFLKSTPLQSKKGR